MQTFKKLLLLLSPYELKQACLLLIMIIIMALLDTIGVASILPFMAVLVNPTIINTNKTLNHLFEFSSFLGVSNIQEFLFVLGVLALALLIISLAFKTVTTYALVRFVYIREYSISKKLIEGYLQHPYSWFLSQHSAELGKTILSEVHFIIINGLKPMMELISRGMIVIALIALLILTDPKLALIISLVLGGPFALVFYIARNYLNKIGNERLNNNQLRFKTVSEVFGAIKEVKLKGLEKKYTNEFSGSAKIFAKSQAASETISLLPRYMIEAIAFGGILLIILYLISRSESFTEILPILSLFAFAGYRLMPALQVVYTSLTNLTFIGPSLNKLHNDLRKLKSTDQSSEQGYLPLRKNITLNNISFNYPNTTRIALKDINLTIPIKKTIGLIGTTGSGKTTVVDIILGLIEAQKGTLEVDGTIIKNFNVKSWQRNIGYVPQHIYLSDDTIAANIAFGEFKNKINKDMVIKAAKIANLHKFVSDELPEKYQTLIGENGTRLSGGQRQRIGIARALYHKPQILILDEATSALDIKTEKAVMDSVNKLSKNLTIILITHRLNTVKNCDIVYLLEKGQLKSRGTFNELKKISNIFGENTT